MSSTLWKHSKLGRCIYQCFRLFVRLDDWLCVTEYKSVDAIVSQIAFLLASCSFDSLAVRDAPVKLTFEQSNEVDGTIVALPRSRYIPTVERV
jgi:hypothetical protein